jgi:hypothetical protein
VVGFCAMCAWRVYVYEVSMKYYQMSDKILLETWDGREPAVLFQRSHDFMQTKTGSLFVDYTTNENGEPFKGALICDLDDEDQTGVLPTIFMSPALIGTQDFYQELRAIGVENIEVHPVIIRDHVNNKVIDNYVVLNVLGCVSCAVMDESDCEQLNDDASPDQPNESMNFINDLVIDSHKVGELDLFLVHEDTDCILVSKRVYQHLKSKGYNDIFFLEVKQL